MATPVRLALFTAGAIAVFVAAFGIGRLVTADEDDRSRSPAGLQVTETGYTLRPVTRRLDEEDELQFTITGPDGTVVTGYSPLQGSPLHAYLVGRDLDEYRHLHPVRSADGTFSAPIDDLDPGSYRMFAVFRPKAAEASITLGVDVSAEGDYTPQDLPTPTRLVHVDDFEVSVAGWLRPRRSSSLTFSIIRNGEPVRDLTATGHLVAVRSGDLALVETEPIKGGSGPDLGFDVPIPSPGEYRLFLDFNHEGSVHTAAFIMRA